MFEWIFLFLQLLSPLIIIYILRFIQVRLVKNSRKSPPKTVMLIFGSGGHTSEMLMLMKDFKFNDFQTVYFLKASSDVTSQQKVEAYFKQGSLNLDLKKIKWIDIPRSREVKQSYLTSILTTLYSIYYSYVLLTFRLEHIDLLSKILNFFLFF